MTIILLMFIGMVLPVEGNAGGSFDVPKVEEDFGQYDQAPGQAEPIEPVSPDVQGEGGLWDRLTESASSVWEWSKEKVSAAWNWTNETASAFWDVIVRIIAKIAEVIVDALSAAWDWILEHKGIIVLILSILGVIAVAVGVVAGISVVAFAGIAILAGELIGGLFSWLAGNELFGDEMLFDILIGGIAGGIAALFGWAVGAGTAGSSLTAWIGLKIPWLRRAFSKMVGGGVAGGTDQSVTDLLKEGKINWKKTIIATGLGFVLVFGGEYIGSHSEDIIQKINHVNISCVTEVFSDGTVSAPKTIGDTGFGQWLQRFASNDGKETGIVVKDILLPSLKIDSKKLQKKYKHAIDFGLPQNYNPQNAERFKQVIEQHVQTADTIYKSKYRNPPEIYVYLKGNLAVYTDLNGEFVSAWRLNATQIQYHKTYGTLIK
ncbi:colicin D domain-containing protein [Thermoactinomyces mirandus]|nr:colicin D domain-containing protein [Thermoactinomyces mirandus]